MKKSVFLFLMSVIVFAASQAVFAETYDQKSARCEPLRLQCIQDHQHAVTTNIHGVRGMPVWVVEKCGKIKQKCIKGN